MDEIAVDEEDMGEIDPLANEASPTDDSGMLELRYFASLPASSFLSCHFFLPFILAH